ncbi:MAG: TolC family protein [Bacteroidales bacterium]
MTILTFKEILRRALSSTFFLIFCLTAANGQTESKWLKTPLPESYPADSFIQQKLPIEEQWWNSFNDPLLDSLINVAMKNNYDLLIASNRIRQAKAAMMSAYGGLLPSFALSAGWERSRSSENMSSMTMATNPYASYFSGAVSMNWEIDLFGSIWQKARSQKDLYRASKADYNGTMVSVAASLGSAYINLRTTQKLLEVTSSNIASQKEILRITEARYDAGLSSKLDVTQAKATYYNTRAAIAKYETAEGTYINSIALLLGVLPSEITEMLKQSPLLPNPDRLVPVSVPAQLLRQRPDVRAAEYQVSSQAALVGAARADWFPSFFLTGEIGVASHDMDQLFKKPSMVWQIAPVMKWTIFNGGQRAMAVSSAKAALESSVNNYNLTVLTALQEVDNAIISYKFSVKETVELTTAVQEAKNSLELSVELYKMGLAAFINVVNSQQSLLSYQTSLVNSQGNTLLNLVRLYQALGGGWDMAVE